MKNEVFAASIAFVAAVSFAALPHVDQNAVVLAQDSYSRLVTVTYTLTGEPAVITIDFQTNEVANAESGWVSIGAVNFTNTIGAVNQVVSTGEHDIYWQPKLSWPNIEVGAGKFRAVVTAWATNAPPDYCAVCLLEGAQEFARRRYFANAEAVPGGVQNRMYKTDYLLLRKVPAAGVVWRMGMANCPQNRQDLGYCHRIMLRKDYYIGVYEITQCQWWRVYGGGMSTTFYDINKENAEIFPQPWANWSKIRGTYDSYPWPAEAGHERDVDPDSYLGKLRVRTGIGSFDLPTEAQWEYACRAGTGTLFANGGDTQDDLNLMGWDNVNYNDGAVPDDLRVHAVGLKRPNNWGLYDMHGNVMELVLDWYAEIDVATSDTVSVDPIGPSTGDNKVWRGGHTWSSWSVCSSSNRSQQNTPDKSNLILGFRPVCDAAAVE